ncbi:phosphate signaling complex protein PhoU [Desulfitobacterium sp.]|uniref:phosphate signaling complex protein PhoU n=1 Tax=Desulfitobacterium sp. TaxID=49981 RepID=UPI002B1EB144|nr:phosphate signaling complex protein PhoU [Desulfitobacterium sp.]MEA4902984.1 phosphate signaling complex protein PhoU [Desulfitobacterium sp.]
MATRYLFDQSLEELNEQIFRLGEMVNKQIKDAMRALEKRDLELANQVITGDLQINELQAAIEEKCTLLIATQQPFAKDLRKIVAHFKISINLERMGDLAVDVAKISLRIGETPLIKPLIDLPRMGELVQEMALQGLMACKNENAEEAQAMAAKDDIVDHLYNQIFSELLLLMIEDPKKTTQAAHLLFAGRHLERMGDYCTNISEEVIYVVTGKRQDLN